MSAAVGTKKVKAIPPPTVPTSIAAREAVSTQSGVEEGIFAGGCFWGTEHEFTSHFGHLPSFSATSGYTGGHKENPTYREVCTGNTGHAEAVKVRFDRSTVAYAELVEFFYRTHDPTTADRQGPDTGSQYRTAIFTTTPEQAELARKVTEEVQDKYFTPKGEKIATELKEAGKWFDAEPYHQLYLDNNPSGYQCPTHFKHW